MTLRRRNMSFKLRVALHLLAHADPVGVSDMEM